MKFRVSSALKNIIGRDLITDDFIAIFELVKNSYDAGAQKVTISFGDDKITISDDGKGMSKRDIENKWLFVAYSAKKDGSEDIKDKTKHYAGAKGIGRFSCDRLGDNLKMITKTAKCPIANIINVDWKSFEVDAKQEFINIDIRHSNNNSLPIKNGTILEISHLPDDAKWDEKKIVRLKRSLEKLVNPFEEISKIQNFSIEIQCEFKNLCGPVKNQVFQNLNLKTTQITCNIDCNIITTRLIDRGTPLYTIEEPNTKFSKLENIKINLFYLSPSAKSNFTRLMGLHPVEFGSIFLFKNGFRVSPFGEEGDDSLQLDRRKGQGYNRYLGSRELIGYIQIWSDKDRDFKEVTSRDGGLVKTEAYAQLEKAFLKTLRLFEKYVVDITWVLEKEETETDDLRHIDTEEGKAKIIVMLSKLTKSKKLKLIEFNKKFLDILNRRLEEQKTEILDKLRSLANKQGDEQFANKIADIQKRIIRLTQEKQKAELEASKAAEARVEAEAKAEKAEAEKVEAEVKAEKAEAEKAEAESMAKEEKAEKEKISKQLLFHKGLLSTDYEHIINLNHQIGIASDTIDSYIQLMNNDLINDRKISKNDLIGFIKGISYANDKIITIAKFATKANFNTSSTEIEDDLVEYICQYLENVCKFTALSESGNPLNIHLTNNVKNRFLCKFKPIEVAILIDNLMSNSRKAMARNIDIEISLISVTEIQISFKDDGVGIPAKYENRIFDFGFTTTSGSGLGLNNVKEIIQEMNGKIYLAPNRNGVAEFIIRIKK